MLNILFILLFSPSLLLVPIKSPPKPVKELEQEARECALLKVGEVGSVKCTVKIEALVKIQIFWVGWKFNFPSLMCVDVHGVFFSWHDATYKNGCTQRRFPILEGNKNPYGPPRSQMSKYSRNLILTVATMSDFIHLLSTGDHQLSFLAFHNQKCVLTCSHHHQIHLQNFTNW